MFYEPFEIFIKVFTTSSKFWFTSYLLQAIWGERAAFTAGKGQEKTRVWKPEVQVTEPDWVWEISRYNRYMILANFI